MAKNLDVIKTPKDKASSKEIYKAGTIYGTVSAKEIYKAGTIYGSVSPKDFSYIKIS